MLILNMSTKIVAGYEKCYEPLIAFFEAKQIAKTCRLNQTTRQ